MNLKYLLNSAPRLLVASAVAEVAERCGDNPFLLDMEYVVPNAPLPPVRPLANGVPDHTVRTPVVGEIIMVHLPLIISGPGSLLSPSALTGANTSNYHPCVVVSSSIGLTRRFPPRWSAPQARASEILETRSEALPS
ncbi:hypothetical protein K440DRAFT_116962 [Wilcoxina mikolae CBS 423.85]|nr:hypothetical protein K440DRAFT_116962 [Wilcoxina mikolae CBS 423.85]